MNTSRQTDSVVFETSTETRQAIRTTYIGNGRWTVCEPATCDGPGRKIRFRGEFDRIQNGHRAAAQAWIEKHVHDGEGGWRDDATIVPLGLSFGPDDYYWTWEISRG